jgi:hypothetical protein
LNQGGGKFAAHVDYPTGFGPYGLAIADFNQDSRPDLAVAATGSNAVSILLGNGDGTFQPQQEYPTANYDLGIAVGDFTGNGVPDLVTSNFGYVSNSISVLLGTGAGAFQPHVDYAAGSLPESTVSADFNGDGKLDLAVASYESGVSILLGNGDGTFQPAVSYATGAYPLWIAAADFNQDGKQDLVVPNSGANTVSILLGNGDGTFQPHVDYPVGIDPNAVAVGDFNGDGKPDLAVSNAACGFLVSTCPRGTVSILLGNGDGTFQPSVQYLVGLSPVGLAAADLNGDGAADVAVANTYSNSVSVLLNLPVISVFPNTVAFGNEPLHHKSNAQTITIGNPSGAPFDIASIKIGGANPGNFAETNTCPVSPSTLASGATCSITVTFTPSATGTRSAKIEISDTVLGSPQSLMLTGNGM